MYVCLCVCLYVWMDGWMDACIHACMHVWSRVPCSRERELGGPYHWGGGPGIRSPDSYIRDINRLRADWDHPSPGSSRRQQSCANSINVFPGRKKAIGHGERLRNFQIQNYFLFKYHPDRTIGEWFDKWWYCDDDVLDMKKKKHNSAAALRFLFRSKATFFYFLFTYHPDLSSDNSISSLWKIWKSNWIIIPTYYGKKSCSKPPTSIWYV